MNDMVKLDCNRFFEITTIGSELYSDFSDKERGRLEPLTKEEHDCIAEIIEKDMPIKESMAATKAVFGKVAFINY